MEFQTDPPLSKEAQKILARVHNTPELVANLVKWDEVINLNFTDRGFSLEEMRAVLRKLGTLPPEPMFPEDILRGAEIEVLKRKGKEISPADLWVYALKTDRSIPLMETLGFRRHPDTKRWLRFVGITKPPYSGSNV